MTAALILLFSLFNTAGADVPPLSVTVELSPSEVRVGDPAELVVTLRAAGAVSFKTEKPPEGGGELLMKELDTADALDALGMRLLKKRYRLVPFAVGKHRTPRLYFEAIGPDGKATTISAPPTLLVVNSISPETDGPTEIKGLKDPLGPAARKAQSPLWIWLLAGAIAAVLAAGVVIYLLRRPVPARLKRMIRLSPAEWALRGLQTLAASSLLRDGKVKAFYTKLAKIARRYLGLRYHILAMEMTSAELMTSLRQIPGDDRPWLTSLGGVLEVSDLVKFARLVPPPDGGLESIEAAKGIVLATRDDLPQGTGPGVAVSKASENGA